MKITMHFLFAVLLCCLSFQNIMASDAPTKWASLEPSILNVITANAAFCGSEDGSISISAIGMGELEYSIDGGMSWQNSGSFPLLAPGDYQLMVMDESEMTVAYSGNPVTLGIDDPLPSMEYSQSVMYTACEVDGSISVSSLARGNSFSVSFDGGSSFVPVTNGFSNEHIPAGGYHLILKNDCGGEADYGIVSFADLTPPLIVNVQVAPPSSLSANDGTGTVTTNNNNLYHFSIDGGQTWQLSPVIGGLAPGTHEVFVENIEGNCQIVSATFEVTYTYVGPAITEIEIMPIPECGALGGITIVATASEPLEYSINNGNTWQSSPVFSGLSAGDYALKVRDATGEVVTFPFNPVSIEIAELPHITDISFVSPSDCGASDGSFEIEAFGGDTLLYSMDDGLTFQPENTFQQLPGGIYPLVVLNECGLTSSMLFELEAPELPLVSSIEITPATSPTANNGQFKVTVVVSSPVQFSIDGGMIWQTSPIFGNLSVGIYDLLISYPNGTCLVEEQGIIVNFFTGTDEAHRGKAIQLFPNPAAGHLTMDLDEGIALEDIKSITVFNILGKIVLQQNSLENNTIDVSHLTGGGYFLKLEMKEGFRIGRFEKM